MYVCEDFRAVCSRKANMYACSPDLIQFAIITSDVLVNGRAVALSSAGACVLVRIIEWHRLFNMPLQDGPRN